LQNILNKRARMIAEKKEIAEQNEVAGGDEENLN